MASYDTATPLDNYLLQAWIGRIMVVVFVSAAAFAGALAVDVFRQLFTGDAPLNAPEVWRSVGVGVFIGGLSRIVSAGLELVPGPRTGLPLWSLPGVDEYLP